MKNTIFATRNNFGRLLAFLLLTAIVWPATGQIVIDDCMVERSTDGIRWQEIGRKNGLTNSSVAVQYSLEDQSPLARAYYRLRSVDFDGKESRSNAILVTRADARFGITRLFPSPAQDQVTVQFQAAGEESVNVRVLDSTGRLMLEQSTAAVPNMNELPLSLSGLSTGVYTVMVSNGSGVSAPVRLVKW